MFVILNGQLLPEDRDGINGLDRGYLLGDGLFETIKIYQGKAIWLEHHWERLNHGADKLSMPLPLSFDDLKVAMDTLIQVNALKDNGVRLSISRGVASRGLWPVEANNGQWSLHAFSVAQKALPLRLTVSSIRTNETSPLTGIKSLSYLENVFVKKEAIDKGFDDGLRLNNMAQITETSSSNFFLFKQGEVLTPPQEVGILPGLMRRHLIDSADELKIVVKEKPLTLNDIDENCSAFITNVLIGMREVKCIDNIQLQPNELIKRLADRVVYY